MAGGLSSLAGLLLGGANFGSASCAVAVRDRRRLPPPGEQEHRDDLRRPARGDAGRWQLGPGALATAVNPQTWKKLVCWRRPTGRRHARRHPRRNAPTARVDQADDVRIGDRPAAARSRRDGPAARSSARRCCRWEHCPEIKEGPGRVVLSTVNHLNKYVFELTIRDAAGHSETVHATGFHKFFSASRNGWISAAHWQKGEQLRGVNGALTVADLRRFSGVHRVYNMTVEDEHVYRVSVLGALVHNVCPGDGKSRWNMGKNAEEQLNDVEETQNNANANRPSIQDENSDWDGAKTRPKQNTVNKTDKSRGCANNRRGKARTFDACCAARIT